MSIELDEATHTRFWSKVDRSGDCWLWQAATANGYGRFWFDGRFVGAHRFSFLISGGALPADEMVCHTCDTPLCVRPDHLFAGTAQVNVDDRDAKGRGNCGRGARHGMARLADDDVRAVRAAVASGEPQISVASRLGLHRNTVYAIVHRLRWAHLQ